MTLEDFAREQCDQLSKIIPIVDRELDHEQLSANQSLMVAIAILEMYAQLGE